MSVLRPDWRFTALVSSADAARAHEAFAAAPNLRIQPCDIAPFSLREQMALPRLATGYDLTWFTNYWAPLRWSGRFVTTVHDMLHLMPQLLPASRLNRRLALATFRKVRRDAAAVMFDSRFTEREFRTMIGDPRLGVTVPLGGDHLHYRFTPKRKQVLAVAAPKKHKNFALLLDAWRAAGIPPDWTLTIVAPNEAMRATIDLDGLASAVSNVDVRRGVTNAELAELFSTSAIVLTPSLYEGFGLPLLEGLLAGALCVSSPAGSMIEIAEGSFVLFANGDDRLGWTASIEAACRLIDDGHPGLAGLLHHNQTHAGRFRWSDTAGQIATVLDRALRSTAQQGQS